VKKQELPGWFPFALAASFLVMVGAGLRSNWGRSTAAAPPPPPPIPPGPPAVKQAGVLQDWGIGGSTKRWFFWYVLPIGATEYGSKGPEYLTDQGAFQLEFETKTSSLGVRLYRFVWIPAKGAWVYDNRDEPALLASRAIHDQQGAVVG
jgi:hypothetical protein